MTVEDINKRYMATRGATGEGSGGVKEEGSKDEL